MLRIEKTEKQLMIASLFMFFLKEASALYNTSSYSYISFDT